MTNNANPRPLRLGVNIDHVATIRNARGGDHPDPVRAAQIVAQVGGDGITAHLREDRRHIRDDDLRRIQEATDLPLNLEMAATEEMLSIALAHRPHAACVVPEKREERTTEGGLDAAGMHNTLVPIVSRLRDQGIRVSLFIEAQERQLEAALRLGVPVVEFHTGEYAHATGEDRARELRRIAGGQERDRAACGAWPDVRQCAADRRHSATGRTQHRALPRGGGGFCGPGAGGAAHARADGRGAVSNPVAHRKGTGLVLILALIPFLLSIFLLGLGLRYGIMREFAVGWPLFQLFGYAIAYRMSRGDLTQPFFKTQVALHWLMLALLAAIFSRAL